MQNSEFQNPRFSTSSLVPCATHHSSDGILLILIAAAADTEANDLALSFARRFTGRFSSGERFRIRRLAAGLLGTWKPTKNQQSYPRSSKLF